MQLCPTVPKYPSQSRRVFYLRCKSCFIKNRSGDSATDGWSLWFLSNKISDLNTRRRVLLKVYFGHVLNNKLNCLFSACSLCYINSHFSSSATLISNLFILLIKNSLHFLSQPVQSFTTNINIKLLFKKKFFLSQYNNLPETSALSG